MAKTLASKLLESSLRHFRVGHRHLEVSALLYRHRNAIAHGKSKTLLHDFGSSMEGLGADLPIVKLLARLVVETA